MQVIVEISDSDLICLKNDLLDVDDWVQKAVKGKISKCKGRLIQEWLPRLMADPALTTIPSNEDELISYIVSRPDYKDRDAQELENPNRAI